MEERMIERRVDRIALRLLKAPSALELRVLSVRIGQQILPDTTRPRQGPEPDLASVLLARLVAMIGADALFRPPDAVERIVTRQKMIALRSAEGITLEHGKIASLLVHGPRMHVARVADVLGAGEEEARIPADRIRGVHPMIIRLGQTRSVVPGRPRLELLRSGAKPHLHLPARTCDVLLGRDEATDGRIRIGAHEPVDGRRTGRRMADDAEVELDAAGGPGSARRHVTELDDVIVVDEVDPRPKILRPPDLAADFRCQDDAEKTVFQRHRLPCPHLARRRRSVEATVRIALLPNARHRIGIRERIRLHRPCAHGNRRRLGRLKNARTQQKKNSRQSNSKQIAHMPSL